MKAERTTTVTLTLTMDEDEYKGLLQDLDTAADCCYEVGSHTLAAELGVLHHRPTTRTRTAPPRTPT